MKPIPYNHPFRVIWNLSVLTAILVFFINTFYRIVFDSFSVDAIYVGAVCVFIVDAALNFFTTVKIGHIKYESFAEIRGRYLKKDFYIDLFSAAPIEYVLLAAGAGIQPDSPAHTAMLALHALSLVKLCKVSRIFRELGETIPILPSVWRLIHFAYWLALTVHGIVIGWLLIGAGEAHRSAGDQYLRGLYWAITTVSTIGYGDYGPDHDSNIQVFYTLLVELFGVGMFSYVVANVSSLISNLDISRSSWQRRLEEINAYMISQNIPKDLQERVKDYYSYLWTKQKGVDMTTALDGIPGGLSQEIRLFLNKDMLSKVHIFKSAEELFLREAVRLMKPQVFLPGEFIIRQGEFADCMYFLAAGEVLVQINGTEVARLGAGSTFGEMALVTNQYRNASVIALNYGTGYRLEKDDFYVLRTRYPEFDRQVEEITKERTT